MTSLSIRVRNDEKAIDLAREIKKKVPGLQCSACEQRDFGLLEEPSAGQRTHLERGQFNVGLLAGMKITQPLVTLICTNCGHLVQFSEAALLGAKPDQYGAVASDG